MVMQTNVKQSKGRGRVTFKAYDKVLVPIDKNGDRLIWRPDVFLYAVGKYYVTLSGFYTRCIKYDKRKVEICFRNEVDDYGNKLEPYYNVMVKNKSKQRWTPSSFIYRDENGLYVCIDGTFNHCEVYKYKSNISKR